MAHCMVAGIATSTIVTAVTPVVVGAEEQDEAALSTYEAETLSFKDSSLNGIDNGLLTAASGNKVESSGDTSTTNEETIK